MNDNDTKKDSDIKKDNDVKKSYAIKKNNDTKKKSNDYSIYIIFGFIAVTLAISAVKIIQNNKKNVNKFNENKPKVEQMTFSDTDKKLIKVIEEFGSKECPMHEKDIFNYYEGNPEGKNEIEFTSNITDGNIESFVRRKRMAEEGKEEVSYFYETKDLDPCEVFPEKKGYITMDSPRPFAKSFTGTSILFKELKNDYEYENGGTETFNDKECVKEVYKCNIAKDWTSEICAYFYEDHFVGFKYKSVKDSTVLNRFECYIELYGEADTDTLEQVAEDVATYSEIK